MKYLLLIAGIAISAMAAENPNFVSLTGQTLTEGNPVNADGRIHRVATPVLRLMRAPGAAVKGTILLFPGGGYGRLAIGHEGVETARYLNTAGFDVAILEYRINAGETTRDRALDDALTAVRLLRSRQRELGVHVQRLGIMGYSAGAHLAARTAQYLPAAEQPDDLILIYPAYLEEANHAVKPPAKPARLFALIAANDNAGWVTGCKEYEKAWTEQGGRATFHLLPGGGHGFGMAANLTGAASQWPELLKKFLAEDKTPQAEKGNFVLYVSNQSFDISPVDIVVQIDGKQVVSADFAVGTQHWWVEHAIPLSPGKHKLVAVSKKGDARFEKEFEVKDKHWAVLNYWHTKGCDTKGFSWHFQDSPVMFM